MYRKHAKVALFLVFFFSLGCIYYTTQIRLDYNFQNFFPVGDPDLEFYTAFSGHFENDNDYLLVGLPTEKGIFDQGYLTKVDSLIRWLPTVSYVEQVNSPLSVKQTIVGPFGPISSPYLHWNEPSRYAQDSANIYRTPSLLGTFFSFDAKSLAIVVRHSSTISNDQGEQLFTEIEEGLANIGFLQYHVAGKAKAQAIYIRKMKTELMAFLSASFALVTIFLGLTYRSWFGVVVPLMVVQLGILGILGIMGLVGKDLDLMMTLLPTIMFVVGMSDVVHIMTKYIEELRLGADKISALKITFREVGFATFLTSLTTAVGFFTLFTANIVPIRDFGLYTGIGVFTAFIMAFTVLPSLLVLLKEPKVVHREQNKRWWNNALRQMFGWVLKQRRTIVAFSGVLLVLSLFGLNKIEIDALLLEDISGNDPLKEDFHYFDRVFGGTRPFELAVIVEDSASSLYTLPNLQAIEQVSQYLESEFGTSTLFSPLVLVKSIQQALNGGNPDFYAIPETQEELNRISQILSKANSSTFGTNLTTPNQLLGRITGKMPDIGSKASLENNDQLYQWIQQHVSKTDIRFRVTGTSLLIDKNNEYLADNMIQGLGIAFVVISIIVGIMFKSLRMILITLIPNIIPLLLIGGIMGFFGITLKLSTSIIFTIAFGIAVDDTIHFMTKLRIEVDKGKSLLYALKRTYIHTGKAIIITSIILAGGFLTLIFSTFGGTFFVGLLVGLTLIFALIIDLSLLPVLLFWFFKRRKRIILRKKELAASNY